MDSCLGDLFMHGRRMRPASLEYALVNYPRVIVWMKLGRLLIDGQQSCEGRDIVFMRGTDSPIYRLAMLRSDFEKCKDIAKLMTVPLFPSDIERDWFDRADAYIRQYFG
jgi:hypothetical protein